MAIKIGQSSLALCVQATITINLLFHDASVPFHQPAPLVQFEFTERADKMSHHGADEKINLQKQSTICCCQSGKGIPCN